MKRRAKGWLIALVTVALASTAGCRWVKISGLSEPDPPYMVDRTEGWELSYTIKEEVEVERLDRGGLISKSWKELLTPKPIELLGPVMEEQVEECARKVLQETFGEVYLEPSGKNATVMESSTGSAWIYWDESVLVAFDKETGKVWACVDVRLLPHITFPHDGPTVEYAGSLEEMDREELQAFAGATRSGGPSVPCVDITDIELPLDAQSAYEIGERTVFEICRKQPAKVGEAGGPLYIYYSEVSDAYFVVNAVFIQALAGEDGEQLFLSLGGTSKDESRKIE